MKTRIHTDTWILRTMIVLGSILAASVAAILTLILVDGQTPGLLIILGTVAGAGLTELSISTLNEDLFT